MPKTNKRSNKRKKTRKQQIINMIGCSRKHKHNNSCKNTKKIGNCKYLENDYRYPKKHSGGNAPIAPLSYKAMNQFGGYYGSYPYTINRPVLTDNGNILGIGQNGGNCAECGSIPVVPQSGGNFYKPAGPMPGPIIGSAWGANLKWPGMDGIDYNRNYFNLKNTNFDPQQQMSTNAAGYKTLNSMVGGYRYNKKTSPHSSSKIVGSSKTVGGGLIPQDMVNLGRDFSYNLKSAYNSLNGYKAPVDPTPYKGHLTGSLNNNNFLKV